MIENTESKQSARDRIMHAAIEIMREKGEVEGVTIRGIAKQADVGIGLINYHFQSKERLIGEAVRFFQTREVLSGWEGLLLFRPKNPVVLVKQMLGSLADFMADFPRISRISILNDLSIPEKTDQGTADNSLQAVQGLTPYIQEALGKNGKNGRAFRVAWIIVSALQTVFLRSSLFYGDRGGDFTDKQARDELIDELIGTYLR